MSFKVGDKVKLVSMKEEKDYYKKYLGKIYTIQRINIDPTGEFADLKETDNISPFLKNLELVETYTYEDLKKSPIGTKITFENKEVMTKCSSMRYESASKWRDENDLVKMEDKSGVLGKIIKIEEPQYKTVYEYKPEVLDDAEKRYLRGVIRPYKKVKSIAKYVYPSKRMASIIICLLDLDNETWSMTFPPFRVEEMYKNMKDNKAYTLEELGL